MRTNEIVMASGDNAVIKAADHPISGSVPVQINLFDFLAQPRSSATPEIIRIDENEKPIIPFTPTGVQIHVHFIEESEVRAYVHCLGDNCLLCRAGKQKVDRIVMPVVVPTEHRIGLLMMSASMRPGALLYQVGQHLQAAVNGERKTLFIKRLGTQFIVSANTLRDGESDGAALVRQFLVDYEAGKLDLRLAVQTLTNEQIQAIPSIYMVLKLKGIVE
jgi:hypothetical protein